MPLPDVHSIIYDVEDTLITYTYLHGHLAFSPDDGESWVWADTQEPIDSAEDADKRPCARCDKQATPLGHDACISNLGGVANACCGHGVELPYIQFRDEYTFRKCVELLKTLDL